MGNASIHKKTRRIAEQKGHAIAAQPPALITEGQPAPTAKYARQGFVSDAPQDKSGVTEIASIQRKTTHIAEQKGHATAPKPTMMTIEAQFAP
jgi:hypothetical protein